METIIILIALVLTALYLSYQISTLRKRLLRRINTVEDLILTLSQVAPQHPDTLEALLEEQERIQKLITAKFLNLKATK